MGKKKKAIQPAVREPERRAWDINWDLVNTEDSLKDTISKFKLILESNYGNRDEDLLDADFDGCISNTDNDINMGEYEIQGVDNT